MNNLVCIFFGHIIHPLIGKFATWNQDGYEIAQFRLCKRCKKYFILTHSKPMKLKEE